MKIQIAAQIFLACLSIMKKILTLSEFKLGKSSKEYKYFREQVFDYFYKELKKLFKYLEKNEIIKPCSCQTSLRRGYKECICKGSGYRNVRED